MFVNEETCVFLEQQFYCNQMTFQGINRPHLTQKANNIQWLRIIVVS